MHDYKRIGGFPGNHRKTYGRGGRMLAADRGMLPLVRRNPPYRSSISQRISPTHSPYHSSTRTTLSSSSTTNLFSTPVGTLSSPLPRHGIEHRPPLLPPKSKCDFSSPTRSEIPSSSTFISKNSASFSRPRIGTEKENSPMPHNSYSSRNYLSLHRESQYRENRESSSDSRAESASSSNSSDIDTKSGTVGLTNLGNTCFMNSALQCIVHTPSFLKFFLCNKYKDFKSKDEKLVESFAGVVRAVYQRSDRPYAGHRGNSITSRDSWSFRPRKFLEQLIEVAPQFDGGRQHDCHELIRVVIDQLSEDLCTCSKLQPNQKMMDLDSMPFLAAANYSWKQHIAKNNSFITEEFCGQLVSTIECSVCRTKRYAFDPFYDLSIPFPEPEDLPGGSDQRRSSRFPFPLHIDRELSSCSLNDCINAFTKPEVLAGDNMTDCPTCKQKRESTKRLQVYRFPRILVVHLKRFDNHKKKLRASVDFPLVGFNATALSMDNREHPVYDLFATCEHSGRLNHGHYTATCLDPMSKSWYHFNDNYVSRADPKDIDKDAVYILFYKHRS